MTDAPRPRYPRARSRPRRHRYFTKCARYAAATFAASSSDCPSNASGAGRGAGGLAGAGAAGAMASSLAEGDGSMGAAGGGYDGATSCGCDGCTMGGAGVSSTRSIGSHLSCLCAAGCGGGRCSGRGGVRLIQPISEKGHTFRKTTPRTRASETGPYQRESVESFALSPSNQHCPRGTTISRSKRGPPGARRGRTMSPGMPAIRLQTVAEGSVGELQMTTSPICGRINPLAVGHSSTTSPDKPIVGSIDGPMHCIDCKT